jgi:type I restriction enzyme S subunit
VTENVIDNLIELPRGWIEAQIGDLRIGAGSICDGNWILSADLETGKDVRLLQLADIGRGRFLNKSQKFISKDRSDKLGCTLLVEGDILVSRMADPIARACILPKLEYDCITAVDVTILRVDPNFFYNQYVSWLFNSRLVENVAEKLSSGTTRKRISRRNLETITIPLPPLSEQKRISAKIDKLFSFLDAAIGLLHKVQAQLKRYRQAVLKYAFEGKMTEEWRRTHKDQLDPAQNLLAQITKELKEKEPRENSFRDNLSEAKILPEKWAWTYLDAITVNHDGKRIPVSREKRESMKGEYPYYGASGVIDSVNNYLFDGTYLLIGEDGANLLARSTPIAFQAKGKFWVNNHAHIITPLGGIPISYLEYFINSIRLEKYVTGTAQPKLTQNAMNKIPVPIAPIKEQLKIVEEISKTFSIIDGVGKTIELMIRYSERLRESVLNSAFKGNLVSQDPSDEPAEKLLSRIKVERTNNNKYGINKQLEMSGYVK